MYMLHEIFVTSLKNNDDRLPKQLCIKSMVVKIMYIFYTSFRDKTKYILKIIFQKQLKILKAVV